MAGETGWRLMFVLILQIKMAILILLKISSQSSQLILLLKCKFGLFLLVNQIGIVSNHNITTRKIGSFKNNILTKWRFSS